MAVEKSQFTSCKKLLELRLLDTESVQLIKKILSSLGLPKSGNKATLLQRLRDYFDNNDSNSTEGKEISIEKASGKKKIEPLRGTSTLKSPFPPQNPINMLVQ